MFQNKNNPTINQLIYWFLTNYPTLASDMKNCYHEVQTDEPNPYHIEGDVFAHTMLVCQRAEIEDVSKINKIAALLHDIGKPESREVIPFEAKKPVHSESNELRNNGKNNGKHSGLNKVLKYPSDWIDNMSDERLLELFSEEYDKYRKMSKDLTEFRNYLKSIKKSTRTHLRGHEGLSFYKAISVLRGLEIEGVINQKEKEDILKIISKHGTLFDSINSEGNMRKPDKVFEQWVSKKRINDFVQFQQAYKG